MTVTKQQQLEYLAKECNSWRGRDFILASDTELGYRLPVSSGCHLITRDDWQQERDKMGGKPEADISWHERGEFPPVGCECEVFVSDENKWMQFEVIAIRDGHALGWCREGSCGFQSNDKSDFRPLRTEREKAIDAACKAIGGVGEDGLLIIERIYDAGLLK